MRVWSSIVLILAGAACGGGRESGSGSSSSGGDVVDGGAAGADEDTAAAGPAFLGTYRCEGMTYNRLGEPQYDHPIDSRLEILAEGESSVKLVPRGGTTILNACDVLFDLVSASRAEIRRGEVCDERPYFVFTWEDGSLEADGSRVAVDMTASDGDRFHYDCVSDGPAPEPDPSGDPGPRPEGPALFITQPVAGRTFTCADDEDGRLPPFGPIHVRVEVIDAPEVTEVVLQQSIGYTGYVYAPVRDEGGVRVAEADVHTGYVEGEVATFGIRATAGDLSDEVLLQLDIPGTCLASDTSGGGFTCGCTAESTEHCSAGPGRPFSCP